MKLAIPYDEEYNNNIKDKLNQINCTSAHIGINDINEEGNYNLRNGYSNWISGEPNNWGGNEDTCVIDKDGGWNDI